MLYSLLLMRSKFLQKDKLKKKEKPETYTNQYDKEISKERYISPEERQENLDDSRLIK